MRLSSILSFVGFALLFAATYCPLLRVFHVTSWNIYKLNQPYGLVLLLVAVIGIIVSFLNQAKIMRIAAWLSVVLVVLLLVAAIMKVNSAFSFIPFKGVNRFLTSQLKFQWGWYVMFAGPALALIGALSSGPKAFIPTTTDSTIVN
jgi:predicted membrane channel-forming protein YqfA (hemolysin III family)